MLLLTLRGESSVIPEEKAFDAMRRFYQAQRSGDTTAALVNVFDPAAPLFAREDLSSLVHLRMKRQEALLAERGLALPPPVYAPGETVLDVGDSGFRIERRAWVELPLVLDSLKTLCRMVRQEDRSEHVVLVSHLYMNDDGSVDWGNGPVYFEEHALRQLLHSAGAFHRGSIYLSHCEPDLRAANWRARTKHMDPSRQVKLRVRRNPLTGRFAVFAVVSPDYGALDINELAQYIMPVIEDDDMRGTVFYDSATTDLRVDAFLPGDCAQVGKQWWRKGVQIRANDRGQGGIWMLAMAMLEPSLGRFIFGSTKEALYYTQHQGDMSRVGPEMKTALAKDHTHFGLLAGRWMKLQDVTVDALLDMSPEALANQLAGTFSSGLRRAVFVKEFMFELEKRDTKTCSDAVEAVLALRKCHSVDTYHLEQVETQAVELVSKLWSKAVGKGLGHS